MHIELTQAEIEYLQRTLTEALGNLRAEISNTDTREFRERLEQDEEVLRGILGRLEAPAASDRSI